MGNIWMSKFELKLGWVTEDERWNVNVLNSILPKEEVDLIRTLPLSVRPTRDRLIWHFDKKGQFIVKSAYHVARTWLLPPSLSASSSSSTNPFSELWNTVWKAGVPPKVKMTAWRILSNIVPTAHNLRMRRVPIDPMCILCGSALESTYHILVKCPFAAVVWRDSPLTLRRSPRDGCALKEWALLLLKNLGKSNFECFLMLLWANWTARNAKLWGEAPNPNPVEVMGRALDWWHDFLRVNSTPSQQAVHGGPPQWSCPPSGRLKLNVDGAWDKENCLGGVGIIIRNDKGIFMGAATRVLVDVFSPIQVEALATRVSLEMVVERGLNKINIESDALQIISVVKESSVNVSPIGPIIEDIKFLLPRVL